MPSSSQPVWFITGCSTGLGRELARAVLASGRSAVVTSRKEADVADIVRDADGRAMACALDVTKPEEIASAVAAAKDRFGRIDVLVNNAGYGYQASIEEGREDEIRAMFDANVHGLFAMTREVLPVMRAQRSGCVVNISSLAGFVGYPGSGYYAATKHAVEGFTDALLAETGPLGIHAMCVEPGPFRTDWAGRSLRQTRSTIDDYAGTVAARMQNTADGSGRQAGDPVRAAKAMIEAAESENPPRHLVLGALALEKTTERLKERLAEIEAWRKTGEETDFPDDPAD